ncbi:hypothetical protein STENM223S_11951 [Streptomyces tendae]
MPHGRAEREPRDGVRTLSGGGWDAARGFGRDRNTARLFARVTSPSGNRAGLAGAGAPPLVARCSGDAIGAPQTGASAAARMPGSRRVTPDAAGHRPRLTAPAPEETAAAVAVLAGAVR